MERKLETFLTLCETLNYRRAAERLHLSPARRHQTDSGAGGRVRRGAVPGTTAAACTKPPRGNCWSCTPAQRYNHQKLLQAMQAAPPVALRIGATKTIGDYILGPAIRRFLDAPDHQLQFLVDNTAALLRRLEQGELDFVVLEGVFNKARYDSFLLRNEPYIGICPPGHPLDGQTVSPEALLGQRLILREEGSGTRDLLERSLAQCGYTVGAFSGTVCVSSFKIIRELVCAGYGISFVYAAVAADLPAPGRFFCPPLTGSHELNAVWLKGTDAGALARAFAAGL